MVEVFRTNVMHGSDAECLLTRIHAAFPLYQANFDLEDCDKILRVEALTLPDVTLLIELLAASGYTAEVVSDDIPGTTTQLTLKHNEYRTI